MVQFLGSHGTCESFAESILSTSRFRQSAGMRGTGAYFWKSSPYYKRLAKSWYLKAHDDHRYERELKRGCVVLIVEIDCDESEYLDLENMEVKTKLQEFMDRLAPRMRYADKRPHTADLARAHDLFFKELEAKSLRKIKLIHTYVTLPHQDYCAYYNIWLLGLPSCLISRDDGIIKDINRLTDDETQAL